MTKPSFSNSATPHWCKALLQSFGRLSFRTKFNKVCFGLSMTVRIKNTSDTALIFKRVFTLTITIWVMLDLACVAGGILVFLGLVPGEIFFYTEFDLEQQKSKDKELTRLF